MFYKSLIFSLFFSFQNIYANNNLEYNTQKLIEMINQNKTQLFELPIHEARKVFTGFQDMPNKLNTKDKIFVTEKLIPINNGKKVKVKIIRPENSKKVLPAFVYFHGGGWVFGEFKGYERFIKDLVKNSDAVGIFVEYSLSPEAKFGTAIEEAYEVTRWFAENGKSLKIDGNKIAVVGDSAGANLATVVALKAKEKGTPKILFQFLICPVTNYAFETESYKKYSSGYLLTKELMQWFWNNYSDNSENLKSIYASPLRASTKELENLPPALIQTAEFDVLRDEGEEYGRKLNSAKVPVVTLRYNGMIHDFMILNALKNIPTANSALIQGASELKKHLN